MSKKAIKPYSAYKKEFKKDLAFILKSVRKYHPRFGTKRAKMITKAFWYGEQAHREQVRFSGEPYYIHPIAATKILLSIKPDSETIMACLLHDVIEDTPITAETIEKLFGDKVRFLCEGVEKVSKIRLRGTEREYESLKKLFIAMAKDIRVVFIKLSDRIHNLSTLDHVRQEKRVRIAKESLKIYAPIAEKLGLFDFKTTIEDLCFQHINPKLYADFIKQIEAVGALRKDMLQQAKKEISTILVQENITPIRIEARAKNIYSIYEKMKRKNFSRVDEIYDLFAIRIILSKKTDCYKALGIIHSNWKPMASRFKDYMAVPKGNGYQSLHTTVLGMCRSKLPTEIQIRTEKMHLDAEYGPAAHWVYKQARHSDFDDQYIKKVEWFPRNVLASTDNNSSEAFFKEISNSLVLDRIHVFTPKGDVHDLPVGSTSIDLAYVVHSEIGDSCVGAKVNGVIKPLSYELRTGDVVEIMTKEGRKPNPLWINFAKSSQAISRIRSYTNKLKKSLKDKTKDLKKTTFTKKVAKEPPVLSKKEAESLPEIIIGEETGLSYRLATCCKPLPGKDIIAYNSRGLDFVVHELNCKSLNKLDSSRFIESHFRVEHKFSLKAHDRPGILRDCTQVIYQHGINIVGSVFHYEHKQRVANWTFTVECSSSRELSEMVAEIKKIPNLFEVREVKKEA